MLPAGDSAIAVAASPFGPEAVFVVQSADGRQRVKRWHIGDAAAARLADLPAGFQARGIAAHPAALKYFVSGAVGGRSQILSVEDGSSARQPTVVFQTTSHIGGLVVGTRPFAGDSGQYYRIFFAAGLARGDTSLRTVNERGRLEYQVVGPKSASVAVMSLDDIPPGEKTARVGVPMSVHPRGEPLLWRDARGCTHRYGYDKYWTEDTPVASVPCEGWTTIAPNGNAYIHWSHGRPGVMVIGPGVETPEQATAYVFTDPPVSVPDGRGVVGVVAKAGGRTAVAYVPLHVPLADAANAWQEAGDGCRMQLLAKEAGAFDEPDTGVVQLYSVYDTYNYLGDEPRVPFLATTDLFWENFGAAFNGVFILSEEKRAVPAFWAFVDSANANLARTAPTSKWAMAFAAIAASRATNATGEAALIARATEPQPSTVLDSVFDFGELKPRGHYASTAALIQYFRGVHYLTQIGALLDPSPLAALPAGVQRLAARWIDVYRPFIAAPRAKLVWSGAPVTRAPYAKHPAEKPSVFSLSWGLDNEVLESTVFHRKWPPDEQIVGADTLQRRLHPSGLDVAAVYGNPLARSLLGLDLAAYPALGPVLDGIRARRPAVSESSSVYERWLDALGTEWADSTQFPGAPAGSRFWDAKRLQTGLASWATLREATVLVNERTGAAEAGEGGFEELLLETPRGYVEPSPGTFEAIAGLYDALAGSVRASDGFDPGLRDAIVRHLGESAAEARRFGAMAARELKGEALSDSDYAAIQSVGGEAEHQFLVYKSLGTEDEGIPTPDPIAKIADVAGDTKLGVLEVAVGNPLEWRQLVPFFGRREIVVGAAYSYHEFVSNELYDNERWRREVRQHPHPDWIQALIAAPGPACRGVAGR